MKKLFTPIFLCYVALSAPAETKPPVTSGGIEFIDMGTSVLWATQPLGVTTETPNGSLYRWGAPDKYPASSAIPWSELEGSEWGGNTKCDPAAAALGSGIYTPSKADFEELMKVCSVNYNFDYSIGWDVAEITSSVTGNKIRIVGAGSYMFDNDNTSYDKGVYFHTSTAVAGSETDGYYFTPQFATAEKPVAENSYAIQHSCQILPVLNPDKLVNAESIELSETELKLTPGDKATLTATVVPAGANHGAIVWSSSDTEVAAVSPTGEIEAVAIGTCEITAAMEGTDIKAECKVTVAEPSTDVEAVDLGLSILWGDREVGATSYLETGNYYAWGTVDNANDYTAAVKDKYTMVPDGACTSVPRDEADPTKPYDIATYVLGSNWHTPTTAEWKELAENTKVETVKIDNVIALCLTSKINGNKIYLRTSGYIKGSSSDPQMSTSVIRQTSDEPADAASLIYNTAYYRGDLLDSMARQCYWLVTVRPVKSKGGSGIENPVAGEAASGPVEIYDLSGRFVGSAATADDILPALNPGLYIVRTADGRAYKIVR